MSLPISGVVLCLASASCTQCRGTGSPELGHVCDCVHRQVFRKCHNHFRYCAEWGPRMPRPDRSAEYVADFHAVALRHTPPNSLAYQILRFHFFLGAGDALCIRRVGCNRNTYYTTKYRLEVYLGYIFHTLLPYPLYPVQEYLQNIKGAYHEPLQPAA